MRVHRFEEGFEDAASVEIDERSYDRVNIPDGIHSMTIHKAEEGPHKFPENNPGEYLNLTLKPQSHSHRFVFCNLGSGDRDKRLASQLASSLGMSRMDWEDADPSELIGRIVRVETYEKIVRTGKANVYVRRFLSSEEFQEEAKPAAKPAARTPAQKVEKARVDSGLPEGQGDDIPF